MSDCNHIPIETKHLAAMKIYECGICGERIVPDYEWNVWITKTEDDAKWKRKADFDEECRRINMMVEEP